MSTNSGPSRLLNLPPELRNPIWELCFTTHRDAKTTCCHGAVNLLDAKSPENALLCTCRQIYDEARSLYASAWNRYWQDTRFYVHTMYSSSQFDINGAFTHYLNKRNMRGVARIKHLTICRPSPRSDLPKAQLQGGIWTFTYRTLATSHLCQAYAIMVTKEYLRRVIANGWHTPHVTPLVPPGNQALNIPCPLLYRWYSTHANREIPANEESFDILLNPVSNRKALALRSIKEQMGQRDLTSLEIRGVCKVLSLMDR